MFISDNRSLSWAPGAVKPATARIMSNQRGERSGFGGGGLTGR
jgi:hypothetical protein